MSEDIGRREAHKRATRAAIKDAAMRLVAEQGFEATTVRQIADAAEVTERTFYRYFDGKAGLVADEALDWMERLHRGIRERPTEEPPLQAVTRAMVALAAEIRQNPEGAPLWMFADTPQQYEMLQRSAPRPLLRFEESVADAVLARTGVSTENRRVAELVRGCRWRYCAARASTAGSCWPSARNARPLWSRSSTTRSRRSRS